MASETYASCHTHTHHSMCSDHTSLSHYNRIFKKTLEMITMIMIRRCCVEHAGRSHRSFSVSMVCVVISMETIVYNTLLVASCKSTKKKTTKGFISHTFTSNNAYYNLLFKQTTVLFADQIVQELSNHYTLLFFSVFLSTYMNIELLIHHFRFYN